MGRKRKHSKGNTPSKSPISKKNSIITDYMCSTDDKQDTPAPTVEEEGQDCNKINPETLMFNTEDTAAMTDNSAVSSEANTSTVANASLADIKDSLSTILKQTVLIPDINANLTKLTETVTTHGTKIQDTKLCLVIIKLI